MRADDSARYAVFFAPPAGSALEAFAGEWLGRDAATGAAIARRSPAGIAPERLAEITGSARHYGFHATLKAPFHLSGGTSGDDLREAAAAFAGQRAPFEAPALALRSLDGFIALMLSGASEKMASLAADCVERFDRFRRPENSAQVDARRAKGLTARQEEMLLRWGYPYVFEDFRFHMTLTRRLDEAERGTVMAALGPLVEPHCRAPLQVTELCLFRQPDRESPFVETDRFPFRG